MFDTLSAQVGAVFMVMMGIFAFTKGDDAERIGAGAYMLAWLASLLIQEESNLHEPQISMFVIDCMLLTAFVGLTWRMKKTWPLWAAGLQLLVVVSHVLTFMQINRAMSSFYTVMSLAGYVQILIIMIGTFWAWQERRAAGLE